MKKVKDKKLIIAIIVSVIAITLVAGITYAVFSYSKSGIKGNSITSGNIVFHYGEGGRSISLENAMPMTEEQGKAQSNYFDFTITSKTTTGTKIPYTITVKRKENDSSLDSGIKLYLTEVNNNVETDLTLANNKVVSKYSELATYTNTSLNIDATKNEKVLYTKSVPKNSNNYEKNYRLRMWVSDDYNYTQSITGSCSDSTYTTRETCVAANKDWTDVATSTAKTFTATINVYAEGKTQISSRTLLAKLNELVSTTNQVEQGNGYIQKQDVTVTPNASLGINDSSYTNIIYTGPNPNNFVWYNGEMWRIIGVYNEDSHGQSGQQLVKIIRNESLGFLKYDYKQYNVGSTDSNGTSSNEWSDSQLMFVLNGENALNKGKIYDGNTYTYSTTQVNGNYIQSSSGTYYNIWNKTNGSYLSYDLNGDAYINKTVYVPAEASTTSLIDSTETIPKTLSRDAQSLIQEVDWHLGGPSEYYDQTNNSPSGFYNFERSTLVNSGTYYTSSETSTFRSVKWRGKIGLMNASDYGYATSGGSIGRETCLSQSMSNWSISSYNFSDCSTYDWLFYPDATTSYDTVTRQIQRTMTPWANSGWHTFSVNSYGDVFTSYGSNNHIIRPVLYLVADATIEDYDAKGTYDDPYEIVY